MKIDQVDKKYQSEAILDKDGNVLCPICKKNQAWVAWGKISPCTTCEKPHTMVVMSEGGRNKIY